MKLTRGQSEPVVITIFAAAALILGLAVLSYMSGAMGQARSQQEVRNTLLDNSARTVIVMEVSTRDYVALSVMRIGTPARIYVAAAPIQTLTADTVQLCSALTSSAAQIVWADGSTTINVVYLSAGSDYIPCSGSITLYDLGYIEPGAPSKSFKVSKATAEGMEERSPYVAVVAFIRLGNDFYEVARWYG